MDEDGVIWIIVLIAGITALAMIMVIIAGEFHEVGSTDKTESFTVSNPSVQKTCTLEYNPMDDPTITYYNGTAWKTLTSSDYTITNNILTVKASAMD